MNPKILKNPYFYSAKMAPKKVDNLLTFKGANPLTLWRPKRGQPSASPAYIYIYTYHTTIVYHDAAHICTAILLQKYLIIRVRGSWNTPNSTVVFKGEEERESTNVLEIAEDYACPRGGGAKQDAGKKKRVCFTTTSC